MIHRIGGTALALSEYGHDLVRWGRDNLEDPGAEIEALRFAMVR